MKENAEYNAHIYGLAAKVESARLAGRSAMALAKNLTGNEAQFILIDEQTPEQVLAEVRSFADADPAGRFEVFALTCPQVWPELKQIANLDLGWSVLYLKDSTLRGAFRNPQRIGPNARK